MHISPRQVVLGFCPENYHPELDYLFASVAAEFFRGIWARSSNPIHSFPPRGAVYVPKDLIPDDFREGDAAAWEVEDQPDYGEKALGSRYRAVSPFDAPLELAQVPWASTDPGLRLHLQETGTILVPRRADGNILLEFSDGLVARVRVEAKPGTARSSVISPTDFAHPLEAWPADKPLPTLPLAWTRGTRRFYTYPSLPNATTGLDLSTLEEALADANRSGGLGSVIALAPPEGRQLVKKLERIVQTFDAPKWQARRKRLEHFLSQATSAVEERADWETFLTSQPLFRQAVEAAVTKVREELYPQVRANLLAQEQELNQKIEQAQKEYQDWENVRSATEAEVANKRQDLAEITSQLATATERVASLAPDNPPPDPHDGFSQNGTPFRDGHSPETPATEQKLHGTLAQAPRLPLGPQAQVLSSPAEAIELLEKNLESLGVMRVSSRPLAREILVAASLGQLLLFRGSCAAPLAELVALTLAYPAIQIVRVPVGITDPLALPLDGGVNQAFILEGINRSCLDAFGTELQQQLRGRALGYIRDPHPVLLATVGEGPSCLPPNPHLLDFGPMFDTDVLSWDLQKLVTRISPGQCEPAALKLQETNQGEDECARFLDEVVPLPCLIWKRSALGAFRRLSALVEKARPNQPKLSVSFGWVVPRLLASEGDLSLVAKHLSEGFLHGGNSDDSRLRRVLQAQGMGERQ